MLLVESLLGSSAAAGGYIEDVFSSNVYTGNSSTQTITNGLNFTDNGGLVWIRNRTRIANSALYDTNRTATYTLASESDGLQNNATSQYTLSFGSSGFTVTQVGSVATINYTGDWYAAWSFRKKLKFFDVVTYTGTGANRTIAHSLGSVPGCIIVKRTDTNGDWQVYHSGLANTQYLVLNSNAAAATGTTRWNSTTPTSSVFSLGTDATVNANGGTYVAYLFAHNAGGFGDTGADNVITCGSYTTDASGNATVDLGYEPQWLLLKANVATTDWRLIDILRGWTATGPYQYLAPNSTAVEGAGLSQYVLNSRGFTVAGGGNTNTYLYIAVRRGPMKAPTVGTSVFNPVIYTGTNVNYRLVNTSIYADMAFVRQRNDSILGGMVVGDRLRGVPYLLTASTSVEVTAGSGFMSPNSSNYGGPFSSMNGFAVGNDATVKLNVNITSNNHVAETFRRAPGFFDVVCYTGTGSTTTVNHNLGAVPELMIVKRRNATSDWIVYQGFYPSTPIPAAGYLRLNTTAAWAGEATMWNTTPPTSTVFSVGTNTATNASGGTYVANLFATVPGVSKVGYYTGTTGVAKQVDCGFTSGARFVLVKRLSATGDWYVWDTARGIVTGNDPYLLLNSTAAEVTATDYIDTYSAGFEISSSAPVALNQTSVFYLFLAIA